MGCMGGKSFIVLSLQVSRRRGAISGPDVAIIVPHSLLYKLSHITHRQYILRLRGYDRTRTGLLGFLPLMVVGHEYILFVGERVSQKFCVQTHFDSHWCYLPNIVLCIHVLGAW